MKRTWVAGTALVALSFATPANAATTCMGTVSASHLTSSGSVVIFGSWAGGSTQICNLSTAWKGISPDVCAGWMAKIDAAVSLGRTVRINYLEDFFCSSMPTYGNAPAPYYVMLN